MEYIITIILCVTILLVLKFVFQIKISNFKKIKEIGYDKNLNSITNKLPENKTVCIEMLKILNNSDVEVEEVINKNKTLTYYSAISNHIIIANIKDTFTRIQTIAHECLHSIQNKGVLRFNFIFSNIYILYFILVSILTICGIVKMPMIQIGVLLLLGSIYYIVRNYLELDAMTKAPYLANDYMKNCKELSSDEIKSVMENFNTINKIGIPMTIFGIFANVIIKIMIYCIIAMIF